MDFETRRLRVRDIMAEDLEALVGLWADAGVRRWMGSWGPREREEVAEWVATSMESNRATPRFAHNCVMMERATREVVGWIGFGKADQPFGEVDFGYSVRDAHQGRGFGTEALAGTIAYCFDELGVSSFFGEAPPENLASVRVMEKVGMQRAGISRGGRIVFRILKGG
jgi:ribosomal-protein-alanine N-acetyltransferase